jgi:hypothetical protein
VAADADPEAHGVLGDVEGLVDPDEAVEGGDAGLDGGGALWSSCPVPPAGRAKYWPLCGSKSTMTVICTGAGSTTTTFFGWNVDHAVPVNDSDDRAAGGSRGLQHAQRVRGTPWLSTSTAVPACSTDWKVVARPLANPWLVTRVSARRTTGVSECRYAGMSDCAIPSTPAHAAPLSGWVVRKSLSWFRSQLDTFSVPPYRPWVAPDTTLVPLVVVPALEAADGPALAVAGGGALVGDVV